MLESGPIAALLDVLRQGGFVAPWLVLGLFGLWYGIGWRALTLRRGDRRTVRDLLAAGRAGSLKPRGVLPTSTLIALAAMAQPGDVRGNVTAALGEVRAVLGRHRVLVQTIVILAPLAGLLGTVTGMIETFDSLAEMALFTQSGGIAGGISEALVSTQMGLAVAVPGVIAGRLLDRAEDRLCDELDELEELCTLQQHADRRAA